MPMGETLISGLTPAALALRRSRPLYRPPLQAVYGPQTLSVVEARAVITR